MKTIIALFTLFFSFGFLKANCQTKDLSKLEGTWEMLKPPGTSVNYTILRTYDKEGNYIEIRASPEGSFIQGMAKFEIENNSNAKGSLTYLVKETIKYAADESRIGKIFNFRCGIVVSNGQTLLLTEGGKNEQTGEDMAKWREGWRKVVEFKKPAEKQ